MISITLLKIALTFLLVLMAVVIIDPRDGHTSAWIYVPGCICIFGAIIFGVIGLVLLVWGL